MSICCEGNKAKGAVKDLVAEIIMGMAKAVMTGDTGDMSFPGGFDIDISMKDNSSATKFDVYGDITLKFLKDGKEIDVVVSRKEEV